MLIKSAFRLILHWIKEILNLKNSWPDTFA